MGQPVEFWISGVLLSTVAAFGIVGNLFCLVIFFRTKNNLNITYNNLLKWLAIIDVVFLILCFTTFSLPMLSISYGLWLYPYLMPVLLPITTIMFTSSIYCVLSLTIERYFCVCKPRWMNKGAFFGYILPLAVFSVFFNLPKFFELRTEFVKLQNSGYQRVPYVIPTELRKSANYSYYAIASGFLFLGLLPLIVVLSLNSMVAKTLRKSTSNRPSCTSYSKDRVSILLLYVVVVLMVGCHLPRTVLNCYEIYLASVEEELKFPHPWLVDISHLFLVLSSSMNIFIYSFQDKAFRRSLVAMFKYRGFLPVESTDLSNNVDQEDGIIITTDEPLRRNSLKILDLNTHHISDASSRNSTNSSRMSDQFC